MCNLGLRDVDLLYIVNLDICSTRLVERTLLFLDSKYVNRILVLSTVY